MLPATWSFQATQDACLAQANAGRASLRIAVRPDGAVRVGVVLPDAAPAHPVAHFNGPAGTWLAAGTAYRREASFLLPRTDRTLGQILSLLSGGVLDIEPSTPDLPRLSLPPSGADGQRWFVCARRSVTGP